MKSSWPSPLSLTLITKIETVERESNDAQIIAFNIESSAMDTTRTISDAPTGRVDAIAFKHDDMHVPLPAGETL